MGLSLPPAVSITGFKGGYRAASNYSELADGETADAQDVVYGPNNSIQKRLGSLRIYRWSLFSTSATATSRPITGHYFFSKLGSTSTYHVVGAGDNLFNYTSATATVIRSLMSDNSNTFWSFIQVQDPRSAASDMAMMTNGVNPIQIWDGTATSVALNSFTSATQVPICRYLLNHKERIYAFNVIDATDADASVRVYRTGFGTDGAADPHRFTENFYVGGSSKDGSLQGGAILNEQIVFYKRHGIWKFIAGSGDTNDLFQIEDQIGLLAPRSLVNAGNLHVFLSEHGVFMYDGTALTHISKDIDNILLGKTNRGQLQYANAVFDKQTQQYRLFVPLTGSDRNDRGFFYDFRISAWQPPVTGKRVSVLSTFVDSNDKTRVLYGDYLGFLWEEDTGNNDGIASGVNRTATAGAATTLTDTGAAFSTGGNGLAGMIVRIISGTGAGQERVISSNTATVITVETPWATSPNATSVYRVAAIDAYWRSKDYSFGNEDLVKLFRHVRVRVREEGNFALTLNYIVDFKELDQSTSAAISLMENGFVWDVSSWDRGRWGGRDAIRRKISLRAAPTQSINGTHLALRFSNGNANQSFQIHGFDMELKATGKR